MNNLDQTLLLYLLLFSLRGLLLQLIIWTLTVVNAVLSVDVHLSSELCLLMGERFMSHDTDVKISQSH